jgi:hypothetical protein
MAERFAWVPGTVVSELQGRLPVKAGQVWEYATGVQSVLLRVLSRDTAGEVSLRVEPGYEEAAAVMFPADEGFVKGKAGSCPFKRVDGRTAKQSGGALREGDYLVHEAWSVWGGMSRVPEEGETDERLALLR